MQRDGSEDRVKEVVDSTMNIDAMEEPLLLVLQHLRVEYVYKRGKLVDIELEDSNITQPDADVKDDDGDGSEDSDVTQPYVFQPS